MITKFSTIASEIHIKNKVGACRFFGAIAPINSEEDAQEFLATMREKYPDANHHVWAFQLGHQEPKLIRYSDDGEPANSSGPPIARVIEGSGLTNIIIVVSRYYGGVNQGVGGLIRAYGGTASLLLDEVAIVEKEVWQEVKIAPIAYNQLGDIIHLIENRKGKILKITYGQTTEISALLRPSIVQVLEPLVQDASRGQANVITGPYSWLTE